MAAVKGQAKGARWVLITYPAQRDRDTGTSPYTIINLQHVTHWHFDGNDVYVYLTTTPNDVDGIRVPLEQFARILDMLTPDMFNSTE